MVFFWRRGVCYLLGDVLKKTQSSAGRVRDSRLRSPCNMMLSFYNMVFPQSTIPGFTWSSGIAMYEFFYYRIKLKKNCLGSVRRAFCCWKLLTTTTSNGWLKQSMSDLMNECGRRKMFWLVRYICCKPLNLPYKEKKMWKETIIDTICGSGRLAAENESPDYFQLSPESTTFKYTKRTDGTSCLTSPREMAIIFILRLATNHDAVGSSSKDSVLWWRAGYKPFFSGQASW